MAFLISNFHHVLNVIFFLLGDSPVSEFMCRRFGTLCSIFIGSVSRKNNQDKFVGEFIQKMVWLQNSLRKSEGEGRGGGGSK